MEDARNEGNAELDSPTSRVPAQDDFMSVFEIVRIILKHWRKIALFTFLITVATATLLLMQPRRYGAQAMLQVLLPEIDKPSAASHQQSEVPILSHLTYLKSAEAASAACKRLKAGGLKLSAADLRKQVKIERPPKTNLLIITAEASDEEEALAIVSAWRGEYLALISRNASKRAVITLRSRVRSLLENLRRRTGKLEAVRRLIDDAESEQKAASLASSEENAPKKRLFEGSGEIDDSPRIADRSALEAMLRKAEQEMEGDRCLLEFLREVLAFLMEKSVTTPDTGLSETEASADPDVKIYADLLPQNHDIISLGEPVSIAVDIQAAEKIATAFIISLFISCSLAFFLERLRGPAS